MNSLKVSRIISLIAAAILATAVGTAQAAIITLGTFEFDSNLFGDTLMESDGGTFSASNWLNTVNADPGNPAYLTGANFETGIANIGGSAIYEIGYNTAIVNGAGDDFGIVDASYSTSDIYRIAVSTDGVVFSAFQSVSELIGTATGVFKDYYYNGSGPFNAELSVISLDLSSFGIGANQGIVAVRISGSPEADLIRVAGFGGENNEVPVPTTLVLFGIGLLGLRSLRRK